MASRLVEALVPAQREGELRRVLEGLGLSPLTCEPVGSASLLLRLVVDAERSGAVVDELDGAFGTAEGFRLLIIPVEAALPRSEPAEPAPPTPRFGTMGISREELAGDVEDMARLTPVTIATVVLSVVVASIGILRDNVAVIIGAMVIAPLLGPNVALAFGTTLGDGPLIRRSLRTNLVGVGIALALAVALGATVAFDPATPAIAERTAVGPGDLALALASGSAGTLALTTGIPLALVGVMVAVALLPPTIVLGMTVGAGLWGEAAGAGLLLAVNVIGVNLAGVLTFLVQGVRPRSWWEAGRARRAARRAVAIWVVLALLLVAAMIAGSASEAATGAAPPTAVRLDP